MLQDEDSKFGSLLLIQEPVKLSPERETTIQIGCTLLNLKLEKQSQKTSFCKQLCAKLSCFRKQPQSPSKKYLDQSRCDPEATIEDEIVQKEEDDP